MITAVPSLTAVTVPFSDTLATFALLEDHSTASVVSDGATVAFSVKDLPGLRFFLTVFRVISVAGTLTVTVHSAFTLPTVAVITAVPSLIPVTVPSSDTVATVSSLEDHVTASVVSAGVTVAVNLNVVPASSVWLSVSRVISVAGTDTGVTVRVLFVLLILKIRSYQESFLTEWKEMTTSFSRLSDLNPSPSPEPSLTTRSALVSVIGVVVSAFAASSAEPMKTLSKLVLPMVR